MTYSKTILITGGAGFIGSHVVRYFLKKYPNYRIVNLDKLTYAGNLANLRDVESFPNYTFIQGDVIDKEFVLGLFARYRFDGVMHLAAESHVDRSIADATDFVMTNVVGTVNLLEAALNTWKEDFSDRVFHHVSTDEVYGSLGETGYFTEQTPYDPRSPYSASKAASDHFVKAWYHTHGLPIVISNCSNNYGPFQFPEKLIPLFIHNIRHKKPLPVYGEGLNVRDWLYVEDHISALDLIFHQGKPGETYNIGGANEWKNIDLVRLLCEIMDKKLGRNAGESATLISFVKDRPGHDRRYAIDASKIARELGWGPSVKFPEGLEKTIDWYLANDEWLNNVTSGAYIDYYNRQYRLS